MSDSIQIYFDEDGVVRAYDDTYDITIHCETEEGVIEVPICARPENKYEKLPFRFMIGKDGFCSFAERRTDV